MRNFVTLNTSDQIKISAAFHPQKKEKATSCMIVAPGFACHSQATVMLKICDTISQHMDVLCLDFRGNGESEGGYYFGGKEYLDLFPAFQWAETKYQKVFLLGFSLGAYSSLRATTFFKPKLQHLFLVSCPTKVDDIFWSGAAFQQTYDQVFRKKALGKE